MTSTTRAHVSFTLAIALALGTGCLGARHTRGDDEPGDGTIPDGTVDGEPGQDTEPPPPDAEEPPDAQDPPGDPDPAEPPPDEPPLGDERGAYPAGPYGVWNGDTMANYSFLTGTGSITLQDVRRDASHDLLLLYLGSSSCAYCGVESPELNTIYATYEEQGLEIFGVLSDEAGGPPTGASADRYFRDEHDAEYPYGANEWVQGTLMTDLYPDGNVALPMNFIIDLETMEIVERMDGYPDPGGLTPIIDTYF